MDLDDLIVRLNLASGFRAPNLAELTSNEFTKEQTATKLEIVI
jgi:hypothetical protein